MVESLFSARRRAQRLRFDGDLPSDADIDDYGELARTRERLYQDAIEISALLTPELYERFCNACLRLDVPRELVTPFIYSSKDIQGECYANGNGCVIRFSSGLIDLLDETEFEFVIGHELGHFLFGHHSASASTNRDSLEYFRKRRSQEISCDRIGLVACSSLDTALRALMKTVSGLTERHLRFDVLAFVSQLRKIESSPIEASFTTHPSILIRARALLWFSTRDFTSQRETSTDHDHLKKIDERIGRDLDRFVDGAVRERISSLTEDLLLWMVALEVARIGTFSAAVQGRMRSRFGDETVEKLRSFLGSLSKATAESIVFKKMVTVRDELEAMTPNGILEQVSNLNDETRRIIESVGC